jgi:transcriptional regulator with XRE-family HTH domain
LSVVMKSKSNMDYIEGIVWIIRKVMNQKNITVKDLAIRLGRTKSNIQKWLTGTYNFRISQLIELELALSIKLLTF